MYLIKNILVLKALFSIASYISSVQYKIILHYTLFLGVIKLYYFNEKPVKILHSSAVF